KDGLRFLYTILFAACCYAPIKTMMGASALTGLGSMLVVCLGLATGWSPGVATLVGLGGALVALQAVYTGVICHQLNFLLLGPRHRPGPTEQTFQHLIEYRRLMVGGGAVAGVGFVGLLFMSLGFAPDGSALLPLVFLVAAGGS